jgi:hypothetical protein
MQAPGIEAVSSSSMGGAVTRNGSSVLSGSASLAGSGVILWIDNPAAGGAWVDVPANAEDWASVNIPEPNWSTVPVALHRGLIQPILLTFGKRLSVIMD